MKFYKQAAVVIDAASGAVLYKIATTGPEIISSAYHMTSTSQAWVQLSDPNDLSDTTIAANILAKTGLTMPYPTPHCVISSSGQVVGICMAHTGINDTPPPGFSIVPMPTLPPSGNGDWTQWTYSAGAFAASAPVLPTSKQTTSVSTSLT